MGVSLSMDIKAFWDAVLRQDANAIREYFYPDAWVNWHNTNEHFTVCAKGHKSHVLTAMNLPDSLIDSSLRISLSRFTTEEELSYFLSMLDKAMKVIIKK